MRELQVQMEFGEVSSDYRQILQVVGMDSSLNWRVEIPLSGIITL